MSLTNSNLALIILIFIFLSATGNVSVWFYLTGSFPTGQATTGHVSICVDIPPKLHNITNLTANTTIPFSHQLNATDSGTPIYFYANVTIPSFYMNTSGFISFTPLESEVGNYTVVVWVTHNLCPHIINWSSFLLRIVLFNQAPYWINLTETNFTGLEDQPFILNLSLNATDPNNDTILFGVNQSLANYFPNFSISDSGFINFTPSDVDVCFHTVNITISDMKGGLNSSLFNFTIDNINDPPVMSYMEDQNLCENTPYYRIAPGYDNDVLYVPCNTEQLHFYDNTSLFTIQELTGAIIFTPEYYDAGFQWVRIYVTDLVYVDYTDVAFDVIPVNDRPVLQRIGPRTLRANRTLYINADANDEEDGSDPNANLTFHSTFLNGTQFFSIDTTTGEINVITNDSINGVYLVRICVNDTGITNPHPNLTSVCGENANPKEDCESISINIYTQNLPPNITYFLPQQNMTIYEGEKIDFSIIAEDPEGDILAVYWYKNSTEVLYNLYNYTFTTYLGDVGIYNITVNVTDGELNDTLTWVTTVRVLPQPPSVPTGGAGGGAACKERWVCRDWSLCQNATTIESQLILQDLFPKIIQECKESAISFGSCGFEIRTCEDLSECETAFKKPKWIQACLFTPNPTCYDGIRNCHHGSCEILPDCGGPCPECPTCSDRIQNEGEEWIDCGGPCPPCPVAYPKPPKCGDNRCEISELFTCKTDCGFFWLIIVLSIGLLIIIVYLSRMEIMSLRLAALKSEKHKRDRYIANLTTLARQAIASNNVRLAKELYKQIKNAYDFMADEEKKREYPKLIKLYAEIEKLEEEREQG